MISSRTGEFEAGFDRGGQTREHALLAKSAGVKKLIVVINKMDCDNWNIERYNHCKDHLLPFLKGMGFNPKTDIFFMPISGQTGEGLKERVDPKKCPWYEGPSFIEYLDTMEPIKRDLDLPLRMAIADKYSEMGAVAMGKVTAGIMKKGDKLTIMPNKQVVVVTEIKHDDTEVDQASSGDNIKVKLKNCDEADIMPGYVLCMHNNPCSVATVFDVMVQVFEYKSIICAGFSAIMHIHTTTEEVEFKALIAYIDKKTGKPDKTKGRPRFIKQKQKAIVRIQTSRPVCCETFKASPSMGRFTLRDEGVLRAKALCVCFYSAAGVWVGLLVSTLVPVVVTGRMQRASWFHSHCSPRYVIQYVYAHLAMCVFLFGAGKTMAFGKVLKIIA